MLDRGLQVVKRRAVYYTAPLPLGGEPGSGAIPLHNRRDSQQKQHEWYDQEDVMSVKSDKWITKMAREHRMIEPFEGRQVREGVISYGVSSYGYDMRVADEFRIFTNVNSSIVDPKHFDPKSFVEFKGDICIVPPNSFALGRSVEYFRIPRSCLTICVGKSTYARCGIIVNVTPFEPEWEGFVTLEISNTTPLPATYLCERRLVPGDFLRIRRAVRNFVQR